MADYKSFIKDIEKQNGYKIKVKGGDVGKPNCFNISLVIYKKGLLNHFVLGKNFLTTIKENQELIDYQIIKKRTAKTKYMDMRLNRDIAPVLQKGKITLDLIPGDIQVLKIKG